MVPRTRADWTQRVPPRSRMQRWTWSFPLIPHMHKATATPSYPLWNKEMSRNHDTKKNLCILMQMQRKRNRGVKHPTASSNTSKVQRVNLVAGKGLTITINTLLLVLSCHLTPPFLKEDQMTVHETQNTVWWENLNITPPEHFLHTGPVKPVNRQTDRQTAGWVASLSQIVPHWNNKAELPWLNFCHSLQTSSHSRFIFLSSSAAASKG